MRCRTRVGRNPDVAWSIVATIASLLALGCGSGATADAGLDSKMRIEGAQFVRGSIPASTDGPAVAAILLRTNTVWPGDSNKPITGSLDPTATAVALAVNDDPGYWIVPAGPADFTTPTLPSFRATASFGASLLPGAYTFEARAVDASARFGPPTRQVLTALAAPPSTNGVASDLVVTLAWDTESDLDLHLVDPAGDEIFHGDATTLDTFTPGSTSSSSYGFLDVDSNAGCAIDGLRQESVIWVGPPASGHYQVRVDTASLCGQPIAHFSVRVSLKNVVIGEASGVGIDSDTSGPHDRGAGILALSFDVP
jgi:hypothetical protein